MNTTVEQVLEPHLAQVGTFTVRRALPARTRESIGPWVFLDHFGPFTVMPGGTDGVGPHPHAGIETVTYLLQGRNEHRDSAGHTGIVSAGGAQWMTAGRGIVHAERPLPEGEGPLVQHGIQLWTSLPRALKTTAPRYQRIDASAIPEWRANGTQVRVIAGEFQDLSGPADTLMPLFLWHVTLGPNISFTANIRNGFEIGAYVIAGEGRVAAAPVALGKLAVLGGLPGEFEASAGAEGLDLLVFGGAPAEGPLVFHGPFVMNSIEQVRQVERAYHLGQMGQLEEV